MEELYDKLFVPKKDELKKFIENQSQENNYNIAIIGESGTGKDIICKIIMEKFKEQHKQLREDQIIFKYNFYDDINLSNDINDLSTFCKNNINGNKLIYIDNFDDFNDHNQQLLKEYIDKYSLFKEKRKIFFLIKCHNEFHIKDIIRTRMKIYKQEIPKGNQFEELIYMLCNKHNIEIQEEGIEFLLNIKNLTYGEVNSIFKKLILMNKPFYSKDEIMSMTSIINDKIFDNYLECIKNKEFKGAVKIFYDLYYDGFDVGDIYYFFYNYLKIDIKYEHVTDQKKYEIVERLCHYINQMYNGNFDKFILILLTFDIYKIYHNDSPNNIILG